MAAALRETFRRWAVGLLARRRGEVRANQDLRHLAEIGRLAGVFAVTMLLPIAFLAFLALSSIRSEELSLDADLQARGDSIIAQLEQELQGTFGRFEAAVSDRIRRGESPVTDMAELSPFLKATFKFQDDGELVGLYELPKEVARAGPSAGWQRAVQVARAREVADPAAGVDAWRSARFATVDPARIGEAMLGEARSLQAAGRADEANELLSELISEHATDRDERGFRIGDLAMLELARNRASRGDTDAMATLLQERVELLLREPWTIGREAEPAVVREGLRLLERRAAPEWLASVRARLNERQDQLYWAELVQDEIELLYTRLPVPNEFRYPFGARADSPAVWAIIRTDAGFYAFGFSVQLLLDELSAKVAQTSALDTELEASLHPGADNVPGSEPEHSIASAQLGPWLPLLTLSVQPKDPAGLVRSKNRRRSVRIAIVLTAVFVSVVGALWVARMIAWEVENARQRADFAANVSHELRSPITQIRLKGEALQLGLVDPGEDMDQHFAAIVRESERLSRLVDNVLDFAAIERGAKRYQLRPDDLVAVVVASVEAARPSLEGLGMRVVLEVADDLPRLPLDRDAIGQVLTNLLSNAAKYAADGKHVAVRVEHGDDAAVLQVEDRGIGIAVDELPRVFDDFFRSTDPKVRRTKGTGIGLAIVRYIVEAHGGTITVESQVGRGSTFTIVLPLEEPGHEETP